MVTPTKVPPDAPATMPAESKPMPIFLTAETFGLLAEIINTAVLFGTSSDGNGGGLSNDAAVITLSQSLISGNTGGGGTEINSTGGTVTVDDFNIFGLNSVAGVVGVTAGASDIIPTEAALADIIDTNLADNGGPTLTHALNAAGPAVDVVPNVSCALATDQTGQARPLDGDGDTVADCDVGAVESPEIMLSDIIFENGFE